MSTKPGEAWCVTLYIFLANKCRKSLRKSAKLDYVIWHIFLTLPESPLDVLSRAASMVESGHRGQPQTSPSASSVSSTSTISVGKESPPEKIIGEDERLTLHLNLNDLNWRCNLSSFNLISLYRVTIHLVQNLPLTSKQKFRFGLACLDLTWYSGCVSDCQKYQGR